MFVVSAGKQPDVIAAKVEVPTIWFKKVVQVYVKCWCSVGVISIKRHHTQGRTRTSQLLMTSLQGA